MYIIELGGSWSITKRSHQDVDRCRWGWPHTHTIAF